MRHTKLYLVCAAASLLLGAVAHADDSAHSTDGQAATVVYEGLDARGRIVRLTIPDITVETFERVSPKGKRIAEPHWSARIGRGDAAGF